MPGLRVRLLGRPIIDTRNPPASPQPRGRKTWALLARLALADRPLTRRELLDELVPEAEDPSAALRWVLADARRALGRSDLLRGDPVTVDQSVWFDVRALQQGSLPLEEFRGILLDGVDLADCPAFDAWLLLARAHCGRRCREALRLAALQALGAGDATAAVAAAARAAEADPLDESAQELYLRALVTAGRTALAAAHLAACERLLARQGLPMSPALRTAASAVPGGRPPSGLRAGAAAAALLRAGTAAFDAGAADGGVETLRRAADDAARSGEQALLAEVLSALGSALVHAVRGADGEGAVVLHRALRAARAAGKPRLVAEVLRELAFVDVQAGRHGSAAEALRLAEEEAGPDDAGLNARILAIAGMNEADLGHHRRAAELLRQSVDAADRAGQVRQRIWSLGVLARSLMLLDRPAAARAAAATSIAEARQHRWHAFLPWPQALHAELAARAGDWDAATGEAEDAFALACELGDPCWEGMAARALGMVAALRGREGEAWDWTTDARLRCDRVPDRYVWVSGYIALGQLQLARDQDPAAVPALGARLHDEALRADLPEFQAWALVHCAEAGDPGVAPLAAAAALRVDSPALRRRVAALTAA